MSGKPFERSALETGTFGRVGAGGAGERVRHGLRRAGSGFLFATFGVGALGIACIAFPVLAWRRQGVERALSAQRLIHRSFAAFIRLGCALRLFELHESGTDALRSSPGLVVANHPTLLDVVFLISRMPQADCIVKEGLWRNPFLRHVVSIADYIPSVSGPSVLDTCVERLRAGRAVIVFPEGTRSPEHGLRPFKRGAAHIALRSGARVTPVRISCAPPALKKGQPWWDVPSRALVYTLDAGPPLCVDSLLPGVERDDASRAARTLTEALRRHLEPGGADADA